MLRDVRMARIVSGEPTRAIVNWVFQLKMLLVITAIAITLVFQAPLARDPAFWTASAGRRASSVVLALISLSIWVAIVLAGRWIAYI